MKFDILKFINKLRKISPDDVLHNYKKILLTFTGMVFILIGVNILFTKVSKYISNNQINTSVEDEKVITYEEKSKEYVFKPQMAEREVTDQQKNDFEENNIIGFSDIQIENNIAKITLTNNSNKYIYNISITFVDKSNDVSMTLKSEHNVRIRPGESYNLEGFTLEENLKVSEYSYSTRDNLITIDLLKKYALTNENNIIELDSHVH